MMKKQLTKPAVVWLLAAVCCLLWGSAFPAVKTGYRLLQIAAEDTASILLFAGVRFFAAGVLTLLIFSAIEKRLLLPRRAAFKKISILSLFQTVLQYIFFYLGLAFTSGERGSVINAASVFFALLLSSLVFRMERFGAVKACGCLIGFAGVILVSLDGLKGTETGVRGDVFILISSVSYAMSSVLMKRFSKQEDPALLSGWQFMLGGAVLAAAGLIGGGRLQDVCVSALLLLLYLALLSAVAYSLWSILLKHNPVSRVAVCGFMIPVFGYALSALLAPEADGGSALMTILALALVVTGIITVNAGGKKDKADI